ncbi:MAG TPA: GNAT family N-acetyltransferase [Chitinispirillaceae bacterium]|nr:GNAT family N-acetyltransferase [Chitinispirillaceae bacterium]
MKSIKIRFANENDVESITEIYNEAITNTTATFDTEPLSVNNRLQWLINRGKDFPVIVAEKSGLVIGFAALNRWSDRKAYDISAELAIYVNSNYHRCGIGWALNSFILDVAEKTNLHTIVLRITSENKASLQLARNAGFTEVGILRSCGIKFGRLLDVVFMQKIIKQPL